MINFSFLASINTALSAKCGLLFDYCTWLDFRGYLELYVFSQFKQRLNCSGYRHSATHFNLFPFDSFFFFSVFVVVVIFSSLLRLLGWSNFVQWYYVYIPGICWLAAILLLLLLFFSVKLFKSLAKQHSLFHNALLIAKIFRCTALSLDRHYVCVRIGFFFEPCDVSHEHAARASVK